MRLSEITSAPGAAPLREVLQDVLQMQVDERVSTAVALEVLQSFVVEDELEAMLQKNLKDDECRSEGKSSNSTNCTNALVGIVSRDPSSRTGM